MMLFLIKELSMELDVKQLLIKNGKCGVEETLKILYSKWNVEILTACRESITIKDLQQNLQFIPRTTLNKNISILLRNNLLMTDGYYNRIWATSLMEITSNKLPYQNFVQDANYPYSVKDGIENPERKYLVKFVWDEMQRQESYKEEIKEIREMEEIEILFENENGYVAKIKGR